MSRRRLTTLGAALLASVVLVVLAMHGSSPSRGYDVSFPQCGTGYPDHPSFVILGVDGGRASTANPCLADELAWARTAPGQTRPGQPAVSFYINTGNPGPKVAIWPRGGRSPADGPCDGRLTDACSYLYGQARARSSFALAADLDRFAARRAPWWLDVEELNSWAATDALNRAALRGFIAGLRLAGARGPIGIYSTAAQWHDLTGLDAASTPMVFGQALPAWIAGTQATRDQARDVCRRTGFTGAAPVLAQYVSDGQDIDLRC